MKPAVALAVAAALFLGLLAAMPRWTRVDFIDQPSIVTALPERAGPWQGRRILYCQNPRHGKVFFADEHAEGDACPECGATLSRWSHIETVLLPPDTRLDRMEYRDTRDNSSLTVAIVFSGRDRSSIHRPEVCLIGDGSEVAASETRRIARDGQPDLRATVLHMRTRRVVGTEVRTGRYFFAYWFMGRGHETHAHLVRMFWMAWDRLLFGKTYPWAYISIAGTYAPAGDEISLRKLDDLIRHLYPLLTDPAAGAASKPES